MIARRRRVAITEHVWNLMIASAVVLTIMAVLVTPPHHVNVIPQ